jgi:hypothetical protein
MSVAASFDRTWNAAIDVFTERNIDIQTLDKASGLIEPRGMRYKKDEGTNMTKYAKCGSFIGLTAPLASASYNLVIRGDSTHSTVHAHAFYTSVNAQNGPDCTSTGAWEQQIENQIKSRAEAGP